MNFKKLISIFTAGLLICSMAACGNKNQNAGTDNAAEPKDSLVLAVSSEPESGFDPTLGWGHSASSIFHSVLFIRDNDMKVQGEIAKDYKLSDDRLTWTVSIRDDVKFSDGSALKASDVAYSYNTARNNVDSNVDLTMIENVSAPDETTVVFKLKSPQSTFVDKLMEIGIVPESIHKADPSGYAQNPIGCGPYILRQWDKGQQVICERNENYFGNKPQFKQVTLLYLDEDAKMSAVKSGQVDMAKVDYTYADTKVNGMTMKEIQSVENIGICFPIPEPSTTTVDGKEIKVGHAVTSDIAIRKAFNVGFSRQEMIQGLMNGYGTAAYTGYEQMPWNDGSTIADGNLDEAKKILSDAGWVDTDGDGIIEKNGVKAEFDLIYTSNTGVRQSFAVYIGDNASKLGIKVNPVYKTWDEAKELKYYTPVVLSWGEHSPQLMFNLLHSSMACNGFNNTGCYKNATVDKHMNDALMATTDDEANENWKKAIWDGQTGFGYQGDAAWAWYMNTNHIYFIRDGLDIGSVQPQPHGGAILKNITDWKMN